MKPVEDERVREALEALAADDALELPSAALAERLRREHPALQGRSVRRPAWKRVAGVLALVTISGATLAATGGLERLRAWWYAVVIDGEAARGTLERGEGRTIDYADGEGYRVSVRIDRGAGATGSDGSDAETHVAVREEGQGRVEDLEEHFGVQVPAAAETVQRSVLDAAEVLHLWNDREGRTRRLWLGLDAEGRGTRLLIEEVQPDGAGPVRVLQELARPIGPDGWVDIREGAGGVLELELSDGRGWELEFQLGTGGGGAGAPPREIRTPSGRVRVQLGGPGG